MELKSGQRAIKEKKVLCFFLLFIKESLRNKDNDIIKCYVPNGITMKYIKQE